MYTSQQCTEHNSASPITQADIDRENAKIARVAAIFQNGNKALSDIISILTPPVPTGSCSDFTTSASMRNTSPFPDYAITGATLSPATGLGRVRRRRGMRGWDQMLPTGSYATPQPGFQFDVSNLIPVWGCPSQQATEPSMVGGPSASPSVAGAQVPPSSSCWPWPCLLIVLGGLAMLMPSGKKRAERKRRRK